VSARWWTGLAVAAVVGVNGAGIWGIAVARRGALDAELRAFERDVGERASSLERRLIALRADLAFLGVSPAFASRDLDTEEQSAWRGVAQGAVLLFLRGHPEVTRVIVYDNGDAPVLHAGRRGGVPLLWTAPSPTGREGAAMAPGTPRLLTRVARGAEDAAGASALEMEVGLPELFPQDSRSSCRLADATGRVVAGVSPVEPAGAKGGRVFATSLVDAGNWSLPSPWKLECREVPHASALALAEPVAERYRTTLWLNLAVMGLALFLGGFAVQQSRRRERLEAAAREEARVRELERQLLHAERLTTVGRLAAGIAHEINNPLEGMANWLSLVRDALERHATEEAEEHLARVQEGVERVAGIVRQVLAQADPARAPHSVLDLNDVLRDTCAFVMSRGEFASIDYAFDLAEQPLLVNGNATMLGQVIINLILNACEAQPQGGEVHVRSRLEAGTVIAEVADRGPGVAAENRQRIFEPFYSTKTSTGLGLSTCHTIVREHGGELIADDGDSLGAVMRLRLPLAQEGASRARAS
jgi:signal transduction histidine kinase